MFNIKEVAMKNYFIITILFFASLNVWSAEHPLNHDPKAKGTEIKDNNPQAYAKANCPPSNARLFMEFNDVKALIEVGGRCGKTVKLGRPLMKFLKVVEIMSYILDPYGWEV